MIEHGKRSVGLDPHRIGHERVIFVMPNRISVPGRRDLCGMRLVQSHHAKFVIAKIEEDDSVWQLQHLHAVLEKDVRYPGGPALLARGRIGPACE